MAIPAELTPTRLRAVGFDYGDTLVTFRTPVAALDRLDSDLRGALGRHRSAAFPGGGLGRALDEAVESATARKWDGDPLRELDIQRLYSGVLAALVGHAPDRTVARVVRLHQRAWFEGVTVRPGVGPMLQAVRGRGLRVGLCSNAPYPAAVLREQLRHLGLLALLDAVVFSSAVGWRKPHPAIFTTLVRRLRVPSAAVLFVGDAQAADLEGALAAGMRVHRAPAGTAPDWTSLLDAVDRLRSWG